MSTVAPYPNARHERRWAAYLRTRPRHPSLMDFSRWIGDEHAQFKAPYPTTMRRFSTADRDDFERHLEAKYGRP